MPFNYNTNDDSQTHRISEVSVNTAGVLEDDFSAILSLGETNEGCSPKLVSPDYFNIKEKKLKDLFTKNNGTEEPEENSYEIIQLPESIRYAALIDYKLYPFYMNSISGTNMSSSSAQFKIQLVKTLKSLPQYSIYDYTEEDLNASIYPSDFFYGCDFYKVKMLKSGDPLTEYNNLDISSFNTGLFGARNSGKTMVEVKLLKYKVKNHCYGTLVCSRIINPSSGDLTSSNSILNIEVPSYIVGGTRQYFDKLGNDVIKNYPQTSNQTGQITNTILNTEGAIFPDSYASLQLLKSFFPPIKMKSGTYELFSRINKGNFFSKNILNGGSGNACGKDFGSPSSYIGSGKVNDFIEEKRANLYKNGIQENLEAVSKNGEDACILDHLNSCEGCFNGIIKDDNPATRFFSPLLSTASIFEDYYSVPGLEGLGCPNYQAAEKLMGFNLEISSPINKLQTPYVERYSRAEYDPSISAKNRRTISLSEYADVFVIDQAYSHTDSGYDDYQLSSSDGTGTEFVAESLNFATKFYNKDESKSFTWQQAVIDATAENPFSYRGLAPLADYYPVCVKKVDDKINAYLDFDAARLTTSGGKNLFTVAPTFCIY